MRFETLRSQLFLRRRHIDGIVEGSHFHVEGLHPEVRLLNREGVQTRLGNIRCGLIGQELVFERSHIEVRLGSVAVAFEATVALLGCVDFAGRDAVAGAGSVPALQRRRMRALAAVRRVAASWSSMRAQDARWTRIWTF